MGDRYRVRSTPTGGEIGETDAQIVGTGTFAGHPVFRIRYLPVGGPQSEGEIIEFVEQTDSEFIHYGSEGYIPEVDAIGITRFEPPVRRLRSTPVGSSGRLQYKANVSYTVMGQPFTTVIDFDQNWRRTGTETQSSPAGTFADACKFYTTFKSVVAISSGGFSTNVTTDAVVTQWSHPSIGGFRSVSQSTTSINVSGSPFPVPPTVTSENELSEYVSARIGGRTFP